MSLGLELLDELDYLQTPLIGSVKTSSGMTASIEQNMPISGSSRTFTLRSPYFVRTLGPVDLGVAWDPLCRLLRHHGIPIFSPVDALVDIPAASVPARWSGRAWDEPFDFDELSTADLFEIACHDSARRQWKWPSEIASDRIDGLLRSVRETSGGDTPIGVSLPLGCHVDDIQRCLSADVDFISLSCRFAKFEASDLHSLVQCRALATKRNRSRLPLLVTAPIADIEQAHKLLALGASAVSLDCILRPAIAQDMQPNENEVSTDELRRMLPSIASSLNWSAPQRFELSQVEKLLAQAPRSLGERLTSVGASDLASFTWECLRSVSERAQRTTGVMRLAHDHSSPT
ncbi:MAG: hypothetical protein IT422_14830 [Pirellulaceae bacterium]|jgi:hypothetical protein|nr:hypothetical protein [Pirellulaceae bacterium]